MSDTTPEYLEYFGEIKFAEEKSLSVRDFGRAFKEHFSKEVSPPNGDYKFAELNNPLMKDFEDAFNRYFE
ncbi:MAG: hypothetical protein ACXABG_00230 [Promethearchaeota archaeon]|jgi:hypothetical protein